MSVTGANAWATVTGPLTSGMVGIPVTIEYDGAWDGLTKNLVCRCSPWGSDDGETRVILNVEKTATVAHEVMKPDMYLYLGIEGFNSDGTLVMPTTWAKCDKIHYGANTCSDPSTNPELSVWNQLQTEIEQIKRDSVTQEQLTDIQACAQSAAQAAESAAQAQQAAEAAAAAADTARSQAANAGQDAMRAAEEAKNAETNAKTAEAEVLAAHNNTKLLTRHAEDAADRAEAAAAMVEDAVEAGRNANQTYRAIGILGDSYSAFDGWIPDRYQPSYGASGYNGVTSVRQMWWWILSKRIGATILRNSSYSGSTICNLGYNGADVTETSFLTHAATDFGADKVLEPKPDLIIIFGGTNDDWAGTTVGTPKYADWTEDDLKTVSPALCKLVHDLEEYNPGATIVFALNTGMGADISAKIKEICGHYSVLCVELTDIDKASGHPSVTGMEQIAAQIQAALGQSGSNSGGEDTGGDSGGNSGGDTGDSDGGDSEGGDGLTVISTKTFNWDVTTAADIPYETHEVSWQAGDTIRVEYNCLTEVGDPGLFYVGVNYKNNILNLRRNTSGEFVLTADVTELATYVAKCSTTPATVEVIITQLRGS